MNRFQVPGRLRVAVVVQRYGLDINGGAELHARLFVEHVRARHDVTVLTSRARDYTRWDNGFPAGASEVEGVPVLRFNHPERGHSGRARVARRHLLRYRLRGLLDRLGRVRVAQPARLAGTDGQDFLERQGPFCPDLVEHLRTSVNRYDVVVFFTALYYPTAAGLPATPLPTLLVPTLHDERAMLQPIYRSVFERAGWILWNCQAERDLASRLYGKSVADGSVCGVGIAPPRADAAAVRALRDRLGSATDESPYVLFVGRITRSKGFDVLAKAFRRFAANDPLGTRLIVAGQSFMGTLPQHSRIIYAGFVPDADRDALIAGALACVVTSRHESLSLITLESLAAGTPVIVNGRSAVLRSHAENSGAGFIYRGTGALVQTLRTLTTLPAERRTALAEAGRRYVATHYTWARVEREWFSALDRVVAAGSKGVQGGQAEAAR